MMPRQMPNPSPSLVVVALCSCAAAAAIRGTRELRLGLPVVERDWLHAEVRAVSDPASPRYGDYRKMSHLVARTTNASEAARAGALLESYFGPSGCVAGAASWSCLCPPPTTAAAADPCAAATSHLRGPESPLAAVAYAYVASSRGGRKPAVPARRRPPSNASLADPLVPPSAGLAQLGLPSDPKPAPLGGWGSIAVMEYQGNPAVTSEDVRAYAAAVNVSVPPAMRIVGPFDAGGGSDVESALDLQTVLGAAEGAQVWYVTVQGWLLDGAQVATDHAAAGEWPGVATSSWGWSAADQCGVDPDACGPGGFADSDAYVAHVDALYARLAAAGYTHVVSSGDSGASGRTDESCSSPVPRPVYPASSPWVLAVGGTRLVHPSTSTAAAPVCDSVPCAAPKPCEAQSAMNSELGWTSGGGFGLQSTGETPWWQKEAVRAYLDSGVPMPPGFDATGRGYPDVTAPGHNALTVIGGEVQGVDGTSASAPLVAAALTRINADLERAGRPRVGFVNPLIYADARETSMKGRIPGDNTGNEQMEHCTGFYSNSSTEWNPVTGVGLPNVTALVEVMVARSA